MKSTSRKTMFIFRLKCMIKKCREKGKWNLAIRLYNKLIKV